MLGELSFSGYQDFGFKKILLVEGTTEVKAIQQFLRHYKKDHEIVILPLGGSSLINSDTGGELGEIKRISPDVFALVDSEKENANADLSIERQKFVKICQDLIINCHVLDRRALENYFTEKAIKNVKGEKYSALGAFDKLADAPVSWGKQENWRIAREMTIEDIKDNDLGKFLNSL